MTEVLASSGCGEPSDFAALVCNDLVFAPAPLLSGENAAAAASASSATAGVDEPLSTGKVDDRSVCGAWGKVLVQRDIVLTASTSRSSSSSSSCAHQLNSGISIFVGDSLTDLAALVEADVGVLVVKPSSEAPMSSSLQQACTFFGVEIVPLRDYLAVVEPPSTTGENGGTAAGAAPAVINGTEKSLRIYSTDSWFEVAEMLSALESHPRESLS